MSGEKSERLKTTLIASAVIVVVATVVTCSVVTWLAIRSTKGDGLVNIPPAAFIPVSSLSKRTGEEISKRTLEVGESEEEQEKLQDESQKRTFHLPAKPRNFDGKSKIFRDSYEIFMEMQKNLGFTTPGEVLAELEKKIKTEEKNNRLTRKSSAKLFVDPEDIFFLDPSSERTVQTRRNSGSSMLATSGKSNEINFGSSIWNTDELSADKRYINTTEDESDSSSQEDTYLLQLPELMKSFRPGSLDRSNRNKKTSTVSHVEQKTSGAIYQQFKKKRSRLKNNISEPFNSRSIEKSGNKILFNTVKNSEKEFNPELLHEPLEYNYFNENTERNTMLSNKSLINRMDKTDEVPRVTEENVSVTTLNPHISLLGEIGRQSPFMRGDKNLPKRLKKPLSYTEAPVSLLSSVRTPSTTFGTKYQLGNLGEELDIPEESDLNTPYNHFITKYGENHNKQQTFDTFQRRKDENSDYSQSDIATFDSIKERFPEYQSGGKNYRRVGTSQRKVEKEPSYNIDIQRDSDDSIKGTTFRKRRPGNWTSKNRKGDIYNTRRREPIIRHKTYGTYSESMEDYKQYSDNLKKNKEENYEFSEASLDVLAALSAEEFGAKIRLKPKNTIKATPYEEKEESRDSDIDDDAIMDEGPFYVPSSLKIDRIEVPTLTHEDFSEIKNLGGEVSQGSKRKRFQSTNLPIKQFLDELPRMPVSTDHIKKLYEAPDSDGWIPGRLINGGSKEVFMALQKPSSNSAVDNTSQNIFTKSNTFSFNETTNADEKNTPLIYVPEILSSSEMSQVDSPVIEIQTQDGEVHKYVTKVGNYQMQSLNQTSMLLKRRRNSKLSTGLSTF